MFKASAGKTLPTSIIGSLPRPSWYTAVLDARSFLEALVNSRYREQYEDAVSVHLRAQETAGLDICTDGDAHYDDEVGGMSWQSYPLRHMAGVGNDPFFNSRRVEMVHLASYHRIPATYSSRDFAEAGGLMSYGSNITDAWRLAGAYAGRILKGAKPADLPVVQSSKFDFVINASTASMLGLTVPPSRVIQNAARSSCFSAARRLRGRWRRAHNSGRRR
jgi:ABC transporter substrate binding protein